MGREWSPWLGAGLGLHVSLRWWLKVRHGWNQELGSGLGLHVSPSWWLRVSMVEAMIWELNWVFTETSDDG